jgi:hypothetical protein
LECDSERGLSIPPDTRARALSLFLYTRARTQPFFTHARAHSAFMSRQAAAEGGGEQRRRALGVDAAAEELARSQAAYADSLCKAGRLAYRCPSPPSSSI